MIKLLQICGQAVSNEPSIAPQSPRGQYAYLSHFPKSYARRKRGITFILSLMLLFVLWANSQSLKLFSDLILSIAAVQFLIEILSPKRTLFIEAPCPTDFQEIKKSKPKLLSSDQQKEIEQQIIIFLVHNELFRNPDLSLDLLVKEIGTNRTYISEAIRVSRYGSFYKMVNHYRLEYACTKMMQNPEIKMEYLASDCGYSSRFVFARAFKDVYGETPSEWKRTNCNME